MVGKMLVGFDGSEESYKAFDFALDMAASCKPDSDIFVLTVIQPPEGMYLVEADNLLDETTKQYESLLKSLEAMARAKNIKVSTEIAVGHPAEMIVHFAQKKNCPLIIVGHKGRSKLEGMLTILLSGYCAILKRTKMYKINKLYGEKWRRGRDSNSRQGVTLQRFSRPSPSTARPPLHARHKGQGTKSKKTKSACFV